MECNKQWDIEIPDCKETNPDDCHRTFHLYLPSIICDNAAVVDTDTDGENNNGEGGRWRKRRLQEIAKGDDEMLGGVNNDDNGHHQQQQQQQQQQQVLGEELSGEPQPPPEVVGTLPLIFAVHCFGCTTKALHTFISHADDANAVLVLPEGIHNSFNAPSCCGYALDRGLDDVGFLKHVQSMLSEEYEFVNADFSYAVGWSNGGFLVMHAASLFKSIVPISGYTPNIDPAVKKGGTFCVDGICVDAPGEGMGLFVNHGVDDTFVRPTGCCADPNMPKCCCNIEGETCVPVMDVVRNWAVEVNGCELAEEEEEQEEREEDQNENENENEGGIVDGNEDNGEEIEEEKGEDVAEKDEKEGEDGTDIISDDKDSDNGNNDEREEDNKTKQRTLATTATNPKFVASYVDTERGIHCLTATGQNCKANSTICLHQHKGHFNNPSFGQMFPFAKEVIYFFARDACEIHGTWNETAPNGGVLGECVCPEDRMGTYCLDDVETPTIVINPVGANEAENILYNSASSFSSKGETSSRKTILFGYFLFAMAVWYIVKQHRNKHARKKDDRYYSNDIRDGDDEEATELVSTSMAMMITATTATTSSRGFRNN